MVRLIFLIFTLVPMVQASESLGGGHMLRLPEPSYQGHVSVEEAIKKRRSLRYFTKGPLSLSQVGQLLWAAQGITDTKGFRAAPSAGALYPLETYLVAGEVTDLERGTYRYEPIRHGLQRVSNHGKDPAHELYNAALMQECILRAQINIVFAAVFDRTTSKYRERGFRYVYMEAGHAAQNVLLQAEALGLGGVVIGAFYEDKVKKALNIEEEPVYIISVGRR